MNVVDSSAWLEYFASGPNAEFFAEPIETPSELLVPAIVLYEVYKRIVQQRGEDEADDFVAAMTEGLVVAVDTSIAITAARLSVQEQLAMADSIILATTRLHNATLWTQDADFEGMPAVRYRRSRQ